MGLLLGVELLGERATLERATDEAEAVMYAALARRSNFKITMGDILTLTPALVIIRASIKARPKGRAIRTSGEFSPAPPAWSSAGFALRLAPPVGASPFCSCAWGCGRGNPRLDDHEGVRQTAAQQMFGGPQGVEEAKGRLGVIGPTPVAAVVESGFEVLQQNPHSSIVAERKAKRSLKKHQRRRRDNWATFMKSAAPGVQ